MSAPKINSLFAAPATNDKPLAPVELYRQLAQVAQHKLAHNQTPGREEIKAIRELALIDEAHSKTCWPDRPTAALDLSLTPKQLEKLIAAGAPAPGHSPIPCVPLLRWMVDYYRTEGGDGGARGQLDDDPAYLKAQQDAIYRQLKNEQLSQRLIEEGTAVAMSTVARIARDLKNALLYNFPDQLRDALITAPEHEMIPTIRHLISEALTEAARAAAALDDDEDIDDLPDDDD